MSSEEEIAALRREVERRFARMESRIREMEDLLAGGAATQARPRFGFPGLRPLPRPQLPSLRRPPLESLEMGEEPEQGDGGPKFERGLNVPVAANWSRPMLVVTGATTLLLFLLLQLFCASPNPRPPRQLRPQPKAVPATGKTAPQALPPGTLLVTPATEPEGTELVGTSPPR